MLGGGSRGQTEPCSSRLGFGVPHSIPLGAIGVWDVGCWGESMQGGSVQGEPEGVKPGVTTTVGKLRQAEGSEGLRLQLRGGIRALPLFPHGEEEWGGLRDAGVESRGALPSPGGSTCNPRPALLEGSGGRWEPDSPRSSPIQGLALTQRLQQLFEVFGALHLPIAGEIGHRGEPGAPGKGGWSLGGAGGGNAQRGTGTAAPSAPPVPAPPLSRPAAAQSGSGPAPPFYGRAHPLRPRPGPAAGGAPRSSHL